MKRYLIFIFALIHFLPAIAQTDTEFWFVAPEASSGHGDSPVLVRLAALNQAATVTIEQPANLSFTPIVLNIPANTSLSYDLSSFLSVLENQPSNQILNYGLHITSSQDITAYYEINTSCNCNPEIFALKGRNALGTTFYTPFQNSWNNASYSPTPYSSFEIVATEDGTTVTITPSQDIVGHSANVAFQITLNKGETYSAAAVNSSAGGHLGGSYITSDKPIAITIKDDSVSNNGCHDMMGDQIVPINIIGNEYIVMKGFLYSNANEQIFILATQNNTDIFIDGNSTPSATLNAGQTFAYPISNPSHYVTSNNNIYVLHASGYGCEMASALLPPINCTGSSLVYFVRSTTEPFGINVMTRSGHEGDFVLNGDNTLVPASAFQAVPGTNGDWVAAQIQFNTTNVPVNATSIINNSTGIFHFGFINGDYNSGSRYGYFSDYNAFRMENEISMCPNTSVTLDAGSNYDSYLWSTGDTTQTISVDSVGWYNCEISQGGCIASDSVFVRNIEANILQSDTTICAFSSLSLTAQQYVNAAYQWSTGDTLSSIVVSPASDTQYQLTVMDDSAVCTDSIFVYLNNLPFSTGINGSGSFVYNACATMPFCFELPALDADSMTQNLNYLWDQSIIGMDFTDTSLVQMDSLNGNNPIALVCWTPPQLNVGSNYFQVFISDDLCGSSNMVNYTVEVIVDDSVNCAIVLPFLITKYTLQSIGKDVLINWESENEFLISEYSIKRSGNRGESFETIVEIPVNNGSTDKSNSILDKNPGQGNFIYKIVAKDNYGKIIATSTKEITLENFNTGFEYVFDSGTNTLYVIANSASNQPYVLEIIDSSGKTLFNAKGTSNDSILTIPVPFDSFNSSLVIINLFLGNNHYSKKIIPYSVK